MDKILYVFNNKIMIIKKEKDETTEMFYFRLEFIALDINQNLNLIENIKIVEVSKHYG